MLRKGLAILAVALAGCGGRAHEAVLTENETRDTAVESTTSTTSGESASGASTTTTTRPPTTTSTTIRTWPRVETCHTAEPDRPGFLIAWFSKHHEDTPEWTFAEVRQLILESGGSVTYLDRLGEENWGGYATIDGEVGELWQVLNRLKAKYPDGGYPFPPSDQRRGLGGVLRCINQNPEGRFPANRLIVGLPRGTDVGPLLARHGNVETEFRRHDYGPGFKLWIVLNTSQPERLFERWREWRDDPAVLDVSYDSVTCIPENPECGDRAAGDAL